MKLRVKFAKYDAMRFVGHLDIMRYFQKAIRRAELDIAYTGGYSPHQIMSFAAPLGVGLSSNGEYMDIEVNTYTTSEDMRNVLNRVMVPGMEIRSVTMLEEKAKNAMASVAAAEYSVCFRDGYAPSFDWPDRLMDFCRKPSILIVKKTKKSELETDLKPAIFSLSVSGESGGTPVIHMLVDASSSGNIKPGMVMEAFMAENGAALSPYALAITREDTFTNAGTPEAPEFIPLDAVGKIF